MDHTSILVIMRVASLFLLHSQEVRERTSVYTSEAVTPVEGESERQLPTRLALVSQTPKVPESSIRPCAKKVYASVSKVFA